MTTIRQMCDTYNVTPRTLRFYEQKGLLSPIRHGVKREYTEACKKRVELILRLKGFGFSLDEIDTAVTLQADSKVSAKNSCFIYNTARAHLGRLQAESRMLIRDIAALEVALDPEQGMKAFELEGA